MIKILIVDDQNFTRQALQAILEAESDFEIIGKATSGSEALVQMEQKETDIVIVDLEMPEMDGLTVTKIINQRFPDTRVIILSSHDDKANINAAVEAGARGYLLKSTSTQEIADTIRAVERGYFQLGPGLFEKLLSHLIQEKEAAATNLSQLENKYAQSMVSLEEKIIARNDAQRQELYEEIELQISSLKQDFRDGLENFQYQVSNQLQNGIEAASIKFNNSTPNLQEIDLQIDNRNLEQQRYINTLFAGSKQAIQKLETQLNQMRYFVGIAVLVFIAVIMLLLY
ncbi:response regulator transcription factor [Waterburya agarophytonicola K14]|uniref:Response regulator transcription factor n=1 Tax=Waterburya agarophytonicola KI4 TaxID=2874699 RepID=A0A964BP72_9CYAN|nr:response regulator transcription factor [Waterburya agarophytonicola]MCC0176865.1 response regulator transcription factor [Waterburya agarophytonicola KI4]